MSTHAVFAIAHPVRLEVPTDSATPIPTEIVWMPAGRHTISAGTLGGGTWQGTVLVDERSFQAVASSFAELSRAGRIPLDFNHEDQAASAWVKAFSWDAARGIIASVEWTGSGEKALRDREYYSFSPTFLADRESGRVRGLIAGHAAGGLVNFPAFGAAMPALIAARLSGTEYLKPEQGGSPANKSQNMKDKLISMLAALGIKHDVNQSEESLLELLSKHNAQVEADAIAAKNKAQVEAQIAIAAKNKSEVETLVAAAVSEGRITADQKDKWVSLACANRSALDLLPSKKEQPSVEADSVVATKRNGEVSIRHGFIDVVKAMSKVSSSDHRRRGEIYRDCREVIAKNSAEIIPVLAANSLGSLAGDLITLRALDMLKLRFPALGAITTDFSAESAHQGQVIKTRIVSAPAVTVLNDTTGWATSDATTTDVSLTIGQPFGVQLEFGNTEIASTGRDLLGEQVEAMYYSLGKEVYDRLFAVITAGNFANATTKATASVARADFVAMEKALAVRGVDGQRFMLANADIYERASIDPTLVSLATFQRPEVITGNSLPPIAGFEFIRAINLPTTGNLTAFGFRRDALVMAARVPNDYVSGAPAGASNGSVSIVTNPDTGLSVQMASWVDHQKAKFVTRVALALAVGRGNGLSGQRLISA